MSFMISQPISINSLNKTSNRNESPYNLSILQWQMDEDPPIKSQYDCNAVKSKNYIRENIRRLRQLQKTMSIKQRSSLVGSSYDDSLTNYKKLTTQSNLHSTINNVFHHPNFGSMRQMSQTSDPSTENDALNINSVIDDRVAISRSNDDLVDNSVGNKYDMQTSIEPSHSDQYSQTFPTSHAKGDQPNNLNSDPIKLHNLSKYDYLKAHSRNVEDNADLQILSDLPINSPCSQLKSHKLNVPTAKSAKNVQFIRRNINFIRANAHLASSPSSSSLGRYKCEAAATKRASSANAISTNQSSIQNEASKNGYRTRLWPTRQLPIGNVPKYLIKRRELERQAELEAALNQPDPDQPPGHQRMPDNERLETLNMLRKVYSDLLTELSQLPVRLDTYRIRTRRTEIEHKLGDLEKAIIVFSKPKVFIKPD